MGRIFELGSLGAIGAMGLAFAASLAFNPISKETQSPNAMFAELPPDFLTASAHGGWRGLGANPEESIAAMPRWRLTARNVSRAFAGLRYDLKAVASRNDPVPRVYLASLPQDMVNVRQIAKRKAVFFQSVLPLVLQANEEILEDRARLWNIRYKRRMGLPVSAQDRLWLAMMADRYRSERGDVDALLVKVDVIPPSLALAQAAEESGWGTSRFSRDGNAIFGEWTFSAADGLVPHRREEGKTHRVRIFANILDSVRAYARNLNRHRAYRGLREARARMRKRGETLGGATLALALGAYSERGDKYVQAIRGLIEANGLSALDNAKLKPERRTPDQREARNALPRAPLT